MSFKCGLCKNTAAPGTKARMVPVVLREKAENHPGGDRGTEIVREVRCCEVCWKEGAHSVCTIGETNNDGPMVSIHLSGILS
jgi:hypothetical protein